MHAGFTTRFRGRLAGVLLLSLGLAACGRRPEHWANTDIKGYLPDLQLTLTGPHGATVTAKRFRGRVVLLYFGYAHCPDVCPLTMSRLGAAVKALGDQARRVRIVFVSVDPKRDTPAILAQYVRSFSPEAIGLTGTPRQIEAMAKRYRVAYQALPPDKYGNYEVTHSKAVFVFDGQGRARLLISDTAKHDAMMHDLRQLLDESD